MPQCATQGAGGLVLQQMSSQADACTGVVLLEPSDVAPNILTMDAQTGALVSGAVATVWVGAWCWKALVRTLRDTDSSD